MHLQPQQPHAASAASADPFGLQVQTPAMPGAFTSHFGADASFSSSSTQRRGSGGGVSPTTSALLSQFQVQSNPKSISPAPFNTNTFNTAKLSLNTSHDASPPFSSFNPYFLSPSNRCKSPSLTVNPAFTFASAAAAYCPSPSMSHSPRMGIKEANDTWEAQWSPFGRAKPNTAISPANRTSSTHTHSSASSAPRQQSSKFQWSYEEGGHERDKGDDSTSEEEEGEEEHKEVDHPTLKPFEFDFDPFPPTQQHSSSSFTSTSSAPSPRSALLTTASKYANPHAAHPLLSALTPKTRRPMQASPITVFPAPHPSNSFSLFPVPTVTSPPPAPPNSPPLPSSATPSDPVSTTNAPPHMSTATPASTSSPTPPGPAGPPGPSPAALAEAALLKRNTAFNKSIPATSEELFKDLETPREWKVRGQGERSVGFADEKGKGALAEVHVVPDDFTQYPIPKKKGKGKGKEKCRVM